MRSVPEFHVVIPARYGSSRLAGKPLALIAQVPMVVWVLRRARQSGAASVMVATDDQRIVDAVVAHGGTALLTAPTCASGTDRVAEVCRRMRWSPDTIVVNVQGDEPGIPPDLIARCARALADHPRADIATLATPIRSAEELFSPHAVKVVCRDDQTALYFSRSPIPYARDAFAADTRTLPADIPFLRHIGIYAYTAGAVQAVTQAPQSAPERAESLEQLRALSLGMTIQVDVVPQPPPPGVDTQEDLEYIQSLLEGEPNT